MLTVQDWLDRGYIQFPQQGEFNNADFGLQKRIDDEHGKKYFITVWVYDWSKYPNVYQHRRYSFEPDLQFKLPDGMYFNVKLLLDNEATVESVEKTIEEMWNNLECQYYERWD